MCLVTKTATKPRQRGEEEDDACVGRMHESEWGQAAGLGVVVKVVDDAAAENHGDDSDFEALLAAPEGSVLRSTQRISFMEKLTPPTPINTLTK